MRIVTKDTEGRVNGWISTVWNALESPDLKPEQVYCVGIAPHSRKGPHKHLFRRGFFTCLSGVVDVVWRDGSGTVRATMHPGILNQVLIQPGAECALYNYGDTEALVLNLPSPAWSAENPDDHPVENWVDPPDWVSAPYVRLMKGETDLGIMSRSAADQLYRKAHIEYGQTEPIRFVPATEEEMFFVEGKRK